jgi:parvulin-like peptidyl-prolyl isomerase
MLVLVALLLSVGCARPAAPAAEPTPTLASVAATPTTAPAEEPAAAATATVVPILLPTAPAPTMAELRAEALASMAAAFEVLDLPDVPVAASVNGEEIVMEDFADYLRLRLYSITVQNGVDWSNPDYQVYLPEIAGEVLDMRVQSLVMRQEARRLGMLPAQADIDEYRAGLLSNLQNAEELDSEGALLEAYGVRADAITDIVTDTLLAEMLYRLEATVTEEEQVKARHILVATADEAAALIARLDAGEDFATLAQEASLDTGSGMQGGDLGWFPRGAMVPTFEEAAFALEPGQMSDAIQSQYGFHIILLEDKAVRPLDAAWAERRQQQAFDEHLTALESEATIERFILTN